MPASQLQGEGNDRNRRDSGTQNLEVGEEGRLPSIEHGTAGELAEMICTLRQRACPPLPFPSPSKREGGRRANLVRSGSQFVLPDLFGRVRLALNSSGSTVASAVFDSLGVQRHGSGTLANGVVRNTYGAGDEDGLATIIQSRFSQDTPKDLLKCQMIEGIGCKLEPEQPRTCTLLPADNLRIDTCAGCKRAVNCKTTIRRNWVVIVSTTMGPAQVVCRFRCSEVKVTTCDCL